MNKYFYIAILIVLSAILSAVIRNLSLNKISRQLYDAAYVQKDEAVFESLIHSLQTQMCMSEKSRNIMALNFYTFIGNEKKVISLCEKMDGKRLNPDEFKAFYGTAIGFLCDKGNDYAGKLLEKMKDRYQNSGDLSELMLLYDCQLTYDIYINQNTDRLRDLEELLKTDIPAEQRAVYQYRMAKLYHYSGAKDKAVQSLKEALENTKDPASIDKIKNILGGRWELL